MKILETVRYRQSVTATSPGFERTVAQPERHFLRRHSSDEDTEQCFRLRTDLVLAERVTHAAYELFHSAYSMEIAAHSRTNSVSAHSRPGVDSATVGQ